MKKINVFDKLNQIYTFEKEANKLKIKLNIKFDNEEKLKKEKVVFFKKMHKDYLNIKRNLIFMQYQEDIDNKVRAFLEYYITALSI